MNMTYNDYIQNPMGRENAVYSARYMYRDLYTQKLDTIMVRENGKINYKLYYTKDERYIVHMKIPSEVVPNFYYDTVIEFYTNNEVNKHSNSLDKYYTKFYSNDPSFVFTFAHAFIKNKMFVEDMIPKMSKEAVKNKARTKNPKDQVGYVKSIYFAYLLCKQYGLFSKSRFKSEGILYNKKYLLNDVEHADTKVQERTEKGEEIQKKKKIEKVKNNNKIKNDSENVKHTRPISNKAISNVRNVGFVKKTSANNIRKNKVVKKI